MREAVNQRRDVGRPAHLVQFAGAPQLLFERDEVDGLTAFHQAEHLPEHAPVRVAEEVDVLDVLDRLVDGLGVQKDGAKHGALGFEVVRKRAIDRGIGHGCVRGD